MGIEPINNRISRLRIKGQFYNTNVINAYAPTETADQEETEQLYADLSNVCDSVPKYDASS
jgi:hypothetical protein